MPEFVIEGEQKPAPLVVDLHRSRSLSMGVDARIRKPGMEPAVILSLTGDTVVFNAKVLKSLGINYVVNEG